ncbi:glycoside hydrolase family 99-like domain-containing protein [uncultured Enterovirga sp.]|uniref:glycoside hydrolase family 99-like domain-containing protein n=1 Tax=uncultured Enterovirga sp. TaxID=2026352 RepID=UPI0035CAD76C
MQKLGHECVVLVPNHPETVKEHGVATFPVLDLHTANTGGLPFRSGGGPDYIHAFTPRDHVRIATEALAARFGCPYIVHLEDNEEQIVRDELRGLTYEELASLPEDIGSSLLLPWRSHPRRASRFIKAAAGFTCLIDRLLEFSPAGMPSLVFWPGFDTEFENIPRPTAGDRAAFGLNPGDIALLYSGNVHHSIVDDVSKLYAAVARLNAGGRRIRLLRTGWDMAPISSELRAAVGDAVLELGFVARRDVPGILGAADILVQPGRSDLFNDYRFPSKLPEYLVSGRPVILPDSNIGRELTDSVHVLKLVSGSLGELSAAIERLVDEPALRVALGDNARRFALANLTWAKAAKSLDGFYRDLAKAQSRTSRERARTQQSLSEPASSRTQQGPEESPAVRYPVKLIAHYLPQFHPIPENDLWWGKGFTEWTNVVRAKPQFAGHRQPRLPTELGFYDLRVREVLQQQADMAREFGIHGFCFYYYWFAGRRLLEKPLDLWLSTDGPDFPFCICWANENWSRRWDGSDSHILVAQDYTPGNDERFARDILPILSDPRYITVDGAALLLIYRISELPDPIRSVSVWRRIAAERGIQLHVCAVQSFGLGDPRPYGADSAVEFSPPHIERQLVDPNRLRGVSPEFSGYIEDYISVALRSIHHAPMDYIRYRGCFPSWDNTPRRKEKAHIFINDSPKAYGQWLRYLVRESLLRQDQQEPLVFINAWNEWAEGTVLEPDEAHGRDLLDVTYLALKQGIVDHVLGPDQERERAFVKAISRTARA